MEIIDAQIHIWTEEVEVVPPHRRKPFGFEEAMAEMEKAGVSGAVLHPPSWDEGSLSLAIEACQRFPDKFAVLAKFPLDEPERRGELESFVKQPGIVGLRYTFLEPHQKSWPHDGTMDWLWPEAERLGVPIAMLSGEFLPLVGEIAERHPNLKLIIDHFGIIRGVKDEAAFANTPAVAKLAKHPNIAVKMTGGPQYVASEYPFSFLSDQYKALYDAYGPKRVFWGTDITRQPCSWRECVTHVTEHQPWLPVDDLPWVMGKGIVEWLNWKRER